MQRSDRAIRSFHRDEGGAILIYVTLLILAIVALLSIAIDGARLMYLNSNLQEIADAAALAGAKELDGRADSISRAKIAAVTYLSNHPEWSDIEVAGTQIVADGADGPAFFKELDPDVATSDPRHASFIRVTTIRRGLNLTFGVAVLPRSMVETRAQATAHSGFSECAPIQSFLCNPWESEQPVSTRGGALNWASKAIPGQMFVLAGGTGGAEGNWGLIDPPGGSGHNPHDQVSFWADMTQDACPLSDAGDITNYVDPGNNASAARPGMNVRFDNPINGVNNTAAPIVIDGYKSHGSGGYGCQNNIPSDSRGDPPPQTDTNWLAYDAYCNTTPNLPGSCPLPRDRDLAPASSANPALTRQGTGANPTDLDAYWKNHHTGTRPAQLNTRYKIYECEADPSNAAKCFGGSGTFTSQSDHAEPHAPQCQLSPVGNTSRRLIKVALVDCNYWGITGASQPLPIVTLMAEFFMTEPAETSSTPSLDGRIYGELVRTYTVNSEGSGLYHIVQLVR